MKKLSAILASLIFITCALNAQQSAQETVFSLDLVKESIIIGTGVALNTTQVIVKPDYARWHGECYDLSNVNALDRKFARGYSKNLDLAGDIVMSLSILAPATVYASKPSEWKTITVMYAESVLLAYGFKEIGKDLFDRTRPYMYHSSKPSEVYHGDKDWHNSFPSGHSTMAFTGAAFASYVFGEYNQDTKLRWAVTALSYSLAAGTAVLRMSSGNHFLTDTFAGAVIGTVCGVGVPWLHRQKKLNRDDKILSSLQVLPNGFMFSIHL